jgi:hypothetical protein
MSNAPKRRRFQFRLLTLFVVVTVAAFATAFALAFRSPDYTPARRSKSEIVSLVPPKQGARFPSFGPGLSIPFDAPRRKPVFIQVERKTERNKEDLTTSRIDGCRDLLQ